MIATGIENESLRHVISIKFVWPCFDVQHFEVQSYLYTLLFACAWHIKLIMGRLTKLTKTHSKHATIWQLFSYKNIFLSMHGTNALKLSHIYLRRTKKKRRKLVYCSQYKSNDALVDHITSKTKLNWKKILVKLTQYHAIHKNRVPFMNFIYPMWEFFDWLHNRLTWDIMTD